MLMFIIILIAWLDGLLFGGATLALFLTGHSIWGTLVLIAGAFNVFFVGQRVSRRLGSLRVLGLL